MRGYRTFIRLTALLLILLLPVCPLPSRAEDGGTRLVCLNVGKADCMLLLSGGEAYLIDTGYAQTFPLLTAMLEEFGVTALDGVFLTHAHKDHYGGLALLSASGVPVAAWYAPEICYELPGSGHPAVQAAAMRGEEVKWLRSGDVIALDNGASFTVLGPVAVDTENENNNSLVMRFECADGSILLTGDMKSDEETSLLAAGVLTHCDLLKCGHHGDSGATGKALLAAVTPKAALISTCTAEEPDTPAEKTLRRLYEIGCSVTVTQDVRDAAVYTLENGRVTVEDRAFSSLPERCADVRMRVEAEDDLLILESASGREVTVENAVLYSSQGTQLFALGTVTVPAAGTLTIGSAKTSGQADLILSGSKRVWSKKEWDAAVLYDEWGRGIAWADNGLWE